MEDILLITILIILLLMNYSNMLRHKEIINIIKKEDCEKYKETPIINKNNLSSLDLGYKF